MKNESAPITGVSTHANRKKRPLITERKPTTAPVSAAVLPRVPPALRSPRPGTTALVDELHTERQAHHRIPRRQSRCEKKRGTGCPPGASIPPPAGSQPRTPRPPLGGRGRRKKAHGKRGRVRAVAADATLAAAVGGRRRRGGSHRPAFPNRGRSTGYPPARRQQAQYGPAHPPPRRAAADWNPNPVPVDA